MSILSSFFDFSAISFFTNLIFCSKSGISVDSVTIFILFKLSVASVSSLFLGLSDVNESFYGCWTKGHIYECIAFGDFVSVRNDSGMYTQFTKEAFEKFKNKIA